MSAFFDVVVPSRRRERRRRQALEDRLHDRWGDLSITAPIEGGWNSYQAVEAQRDPYPSFQPLSPVTEVRFDASDASDTETQDREHHIPQDDRGTNDERQQATLTLTIPLPWHQKKSHRRSSSLDQRASREVISAEADADKKTSRSQTTSPTTFLYKPASQDYRRELNASLTSQTPSPSILYKPASDDYKKELDIMARRSDPNNSTSAPYESFPMKEDAINTMTNETNSTISDGIATAGPGTTATDDKICRETEAATSSRSSVSSTEGSNASTLPTGSSYSDEVTKGMSELGFSPATSPMLRHEGFPKPIISSMPRTRAYRESISSSSSEGSSVSSPRGLQNMPIPGGAIYKSVAEEYKQIGKTVEDAATAELLKRARRNTLQSSKSNIIRESSKERHDSSGRMARSNIVQDRARGQSVDGRKTVSPVNITQPVYHTSRNMSVDRHRGYPRDRARAVSKERPRAVSTDRSNIGYRGRSRGVPDDMVPRPEELWG